jgi:hypothetical protein
MFFFNHPETIHSPITSINLPYILLLLEEMHAAALEITPCSNRIGCPGSQPGSLFKWGSRNWNHITARQQCPPGGQQPGLPGYPKTI